MLKELITELRLSMQNYNKQAESFEGGIMDSVMLAETAGFIEGEIRVVELLTGEKVVCHHHEHDEEGKYIAFEFMGKFYAVEH